MDPRRDERSSIQRQSQKILRLLEEAYPNAKSELNFEGPYELIAAVLLSAQCTDKKVNEVTPSLFDAYPSFAALSQARLTDVERIIRPVNYYKTKARHLVGLAQEITNKFDGRLPNNFKELVLLPGVGRKTANVVLCEHGGVPSLPVDTHVHRVSNRLGLSHGSKPERIEEDLKQLFSPSSWRFLHHALILHGRRVCKAGHPLCENCPLAKACPSYALFTRKVRGKKAV